MDHHTIKISFHTIGCRLNQYESAVLCNSFKQKNYHIVSSKIPADIAVVNTCTVTEKSDADTRRFVNRLIRLNPKVKIALVGCQAQLQHNILKHLPNVQWIVGNLNKLNLEKIIRDVESVKTHVDVSEVRPRDSFRMPVFGIDRAHTRANLKIQDGCDNFCTYCEVPYARGPARSRDYNDIIEEAKVLAASGHKEIILTGINVGTYQDHRQTLIDVIKKIEEIPMLKRIRLSSIEPTKILNELIDHISCSKKICRHLHIPIQSGHDHILKRMKRHYSVDHLKHTMTTAFETIPEICIGTDIIVGFPGETDNHFQETYNLLRSLPINYFHVFSFSKRDNAKAKNFAAHVPSIIIQKRSAKLRALSQRKRRRFYEQMLGKTVSVLFEQQKKGQWRGLTDNFLQVGVTSEKDLKNKIRRIKLNHISGQVINGKLIE